MGALFYSPVDFTDASNLRQRAHSNERFPAAH